MSQQSWMRLMSQGVGPALIALTAASAFSTRALAETRVRIDLGLRNMQHSVWKGMETLDSEGISVNYRRDTWPVELAFGMHRSEGEVTESRFVPDGGAWCIIPFIFCFATGDTIENTVARGSLRELDVGVEKHWGRPSSRAHAYIGGGPAFVQSSMSVDELDVDARDNTIGLWARAGILGVWPRDGKVQLQSGFEIRALEGTRLRFGAEQADADYFQLSWTTGLRW